MSANNRLVIFKQDSQWRIKDEDADSGHGDLLENGPFDRLEDAVKSANEYMREYEVEYGLSIEEDFI